MTAAGKTPTTAGPDSLSNPQPAPDDGPPATKSVEPMVPDLVSTLREEHYGITRFRRDALAGLTVAIVALPLSMAIAIASGLPPERGLFTAIVGGFIISLLGGSRHQIGGPAGAFIVLVAAISERHGYDGLVLATMIAGAIMLLLGLLRLGTLISYVPHAVTVGFTAGIAVIIFASQIKDLLGLTLVKEPSAFWPKLQALWTALPTVKPASLILSILCIAMIVAIRTWRPAWPALLITVILAALASSGLGLGIPTIGSRFGGVPNMLPAPALPDISWARCLKVLPDALSIALLGSIESLLSAVVADKMSGHKHRSNIELVAQGFANIASVIFGGMPATGTIARTATNVRAGATSAIAGALHSLYLLAFMVLAAGLAVHVPLAGLAAILAITSWNMAERHEIARMLRQQPPEAAVMLATTLITVFVDLTYGIAVGLALSLMIAAGRRAASSKA